MSGHNAYGLPNAPQPADAAQYFATQLRSVITDTTVVNLQRGAIGELILDHSTQVRVEAQAGGPDVTADGNFGVGFPSFIALGYGCSTNPSVRACP
jgi:hypothetical protein